MSLLVAEWHRGKMIYWVTTLSKYFFPLQCSVSVSTGICIASLKQSHEISILYQFGKCLHYFSDFNEALSFYGSCFHSRSSGLKSKILQGRLTPLQDIYGKDLKEVLWIISPNQYYIFREWLSSWWLSIFLKKHNWAA